MYKTFGFARYVLSAAVAGALLASCSGSQTGVSPLTSQAASAVSEGAQALAPAVKDNCQATGGVRVSPCRIHFNMQNPGPVTVTVRGPGGKNATVTESDNCGGASGIATITPGPDGQYVVTAGPTAGNCTATFTYSKGNKVYGTATLRVSNKL